MNKYCVTYITSGGNRYSTEVVAVNEEAAIEEAYNGSFAGYDSDAYWLKLYDINIAEENVVE